MDNFSRYILSWKASLHLSSEIFVENLKEAYQKLNHVHLVRSTDGMEGCLNSVQLSAGNNSTSNVVNAPIELIVDGGPENNNEKVDNFITDIDGAIRKLIAQKDIIFSNSLIEAMNRTLKYGFLFQQALLNFVSTLIYLEKIIPVYNDERPHFALHGQTPEEAFKGIMINREDYKKDFREAYIRRIKKNKEARCKNCNEEGKLELVMA